MGTTLLLISGTSLILIVVGILFGVVAFQGWRRWSNLLQHMVMIEGRITGFDSHEIIRHETTNEGYTTSRTTRYYVNYSYDYEGQSYSCEESISKKHFRTWEQGMSVTVRIPSNDPGSASLLAEASLLGDTAIIWGFGLAGLFCFGFAIVLFWLF